LSKPPSNNQIKKNPKQRESESFSNSQENYEEIKARLTLKLEEQFSQRAKESQQQREDREAKLLETIEALKIKISDQQ